MIRVGISPIGWSSDDLPSLGADVSFRRCLDDAARAGFAGIELGHKFPKDPPALQRALKARELQLVSAWHGTRLLERPWADELRQIDPLLEILDHTGAKLLVVAEVTGSVHRNRYAPLARRPLLHPQALQQFGEALTSLADAVAKRGVQLAFHQHMGTVVQTGAELDALVRHTGPSVGLTFDTGHAAFAGIDPVEAARRLASRIRHVHLKDVRREVLDGLSPAASFIDAVMEGVFTVPGDGNLDMSGVVDALLGAGYDGWMVVEADQDPQRADPFIYARMGREAVRRLLER